MLSIQNFHGLGDSGGDVSHVEKVVLFIIVWVVERVLVSDRFDESYARVVDAGDRDQDTECNNDTVEHDLIPL